MIMLDDEIFCTCRFMILAEVGAGKKKITAMPMELDLSSMGQHRTNLETLSQGHRAFHRT